MGLDSTIFDQVGKYKTMADYDAESQRSQINKLALLQAQGQYDQQQQGVKDDNALRQIFQQSNGDLQKARDLASQSGMYKAVGNIDKQRQDAATAQADAAYKAAQTDEAKAKSRGLTLDQSIKNHDYHLQELGALQSSEEVYPWIAKGVMNGVFSFQQGSDAANRFKQMSAQPGFDFGAYKQQAQQGGMSVTDQIKASNELLRSRESNATSTANNVLTNQTHLRGIAMTQAGENGRQANRIATSDAVGGLEGFSPAAIENAAARYNLDGSLPPMGMGKSGSQGRQAILNRAAELSTGTSGTDQRVAQLDAKSSAGALSQLTRSQAMNASFEKTANANATLALNLSNKLDRTGMPMLNAGLQALRTGTGSPEATQFAAANQTFVAEYAKIMSGGMGNGPVSDAARGKAEKLLTTSMTPAQYEGNVKLLQTEMANRMKGFEDQATELRGRMGGKPVSPPQAPATTGKPPSGWTVVH